MSVEESDFKVFIYQDDFNAICTEVYGHQHIETGGNLFGLWTTSRNAVLHVVMGPGRGCKRTSTSFHQDIDYMQRVGSFVNQKYMLCHIGEWHSHHSLSLSKPSHGDVSTVQRNFPEGVSTFLVIIANIRDGGTTIILSPYFFVEGGRRYLKGKYEVLASNNPFSSVPEIQTEISLGAENTIFGKDPSPQESSSHRQPTNHQTQISLRAENTTFGTDASSRESSGHNQLTDQRQPTGAPPSYSQVVAGTRHEEDSGSTSLVQFESTSSVSSGNHHDNVIPMEVTQNEVSHLFGNQTSPQSPATNGGAAASFPVSHGREVTNHEDGPTERERIIKDTFESLEKIFGTGKIEMMKGVANKKDLQMVFKDRYYFWMLLFPEDFPQSPATLHCDSNLEYLCRRYPSPTVHFQIFYKPLINHVNILLLIKEKCPITSKQCETIDKITLLKQSSCDKPVVVRDFISGLINNINFTLGTTLSLQTAHLDEGGFKIDFEHNYRHWRVEIPREFPDKPAIVSQATTPNCAYQRVKIKRRSTADNQEEPLVTEDLIVLAIKTNCYCMGCYGS